MAERSPRTIELPEYGEIYLPAEDLSAEEAAAIWPRWKNMVDLEFPTPKTDNRWRLKALGWIGHIPVTPDLSLHLTPKVPIGNLFRMLEYAYDLDVHFLGGLTGCTSLPEFFDRLARILARRVRDRGRRGLYRSYVPRRESLPYLRGRLDVHRDLARPWDLSLTCRYEEHTADVEENQILVWTLSRVARAGLCREETLAEVRHAYRLLLGAASLRPFDAAACVGRLYNRLNDDYRALHGLCRFFLENTGPTHRLGEKTMIPFLIDPALLFEKFVARWLTGHAPAGLMVQEQHSVTVGDHEELKYRIDVVLVERATGRPLCVLDTKYKAGDAPSNDDVNQVIAYAVAKNTGEAVLVYPRQPARPFEATFREHGIRVRTLAFPLGGDLEEAGQAFRRSLLRGLGQGPEASDALHAEQAEALP